jgi:hypothetical protein
MIRPGRAGAGCTQFPFSWRHKSCEPPQTNWLSLKSAPKGPITITSMPPERALVCGFVWPRARLAHVCLKQVNLSWTRKEFFRFDRIPILQSASCLCFCSAILPMSDSMAQLEIEDNGTSGQWLWHKRGIPPKLPGRHRVVEWRSSRQGAANRAVLPPSRLFGKRPEMR